MTDEEALEACKHRRNLLKSHTKQSEHDVCTVTAFSPIWLQQESNRLSLLSLPMYI